MKYLGLTVVLALIGLIAALVLRTDAQDYCMHLSALKPVEAGVGMVSVDDLVTCQKVLGAADFHRLTTNWAQRATANVVFGSDNFAVALNGQYQSAQPAITDIKPFNTAKFEYRSNWDQPFLYAKDIVLVQGCVPQNTQPGVMYIFADCAMK